MLQVKRELRMFILIVIATAIQVLRLFVLKMSFVNSLCIELISMYWPVWPEGLNCARKVYIKVF